MEDKRQLRKLFGTDGIRGTVNVEPITSETTLRVGQALTCVFQGEPQHHKILIGKDTRLSGYMLETAMASGICSMGGDVLLVGPLPTPGIAFLTRDLGADAGVMISASHNKFEDNGIKIFSNRGLKLPDEVEDRITELVQGNRMSEVRPTTGSIGKAVRIDDALARYRDFVKSSFPKELNLRGLKVVIDCANGAAYKVAPEVLSELGAEVIAVSTKPDGTNINEDCGALHPQQVCELVRLHEADLGIALDGDADRAILVDDAGAVVDGDVTLGILAKDRLETARLQRKTLVATVMSNLGLEVALRKMGAKLVRTPVGDRYVVEEMLRGGYNIGGEQSGHIILLDVNTTGDGIATFLSVLAIMVQNQRPLSEIRQIVRRYPQVLINVTVRQRKDLNKVEPVCKIMKNISDKLGDNGRLLVRYSGTEPLVRVMVEGEEEGVVRAYAQEVADALQVHIG